MNMRFASLFPLLSFLLFAWPAGANVAQEVAAEKPVAAKLEKSGCAVKKPSVKKIAPRFKTKKPDISVTFGGKLKPQSYFGKNISLLNNHEFTDKVFYNRHTLDLNFNILWGQDHFDHTVSEMFFAIRNKGVWGNSDSIASTNSTEVKFLNTPIANHKHGLPVHIFWIRELWLRFNLNDALGLSFGNQHEFTVGAFPFQLGRGIALGDAFAVGPENLGFYSESAVDQFAFGAKLSGDFVEERLSYNLYGSIQENKTGSLGQTGERVHTQEYGMRDCAQRGFGIMNFIIASNLIWTPYKTDTEFLRIEPYVMYNRAPEQKIEFTADASTRFGTAGLACEYEGERFAFGFDGAVNFGSQSVKGWDRNSTKLVNIDGVPHEVNSHVYLNVDPTDAGAPSDLSPYRAPFVDKGNTAGVPSSYGKDAQKTINTSSQSEDRNGKKIGNNTELSTSTGFFTAVAPAVDGDLFNATNRFRDPYKNVFEGWMLVGDMAWKLKKGLSVAVTGGVATGDNDPNFTNLDGDFKGFIGLQELYSGKRVKSAFVLGGAGRVRRLQSAPEAEDVGQAPSQFATAISGFNNLIFTGGGIHWTPERDNRRFHVNSNMMLFWQQFASKKYDAVAKQEINELADTFLGVELNTFLHHFFHDNLKLSFVGSIFIPGRHFDEIKGKPANSAQMAAINRANVELCDPIPNIGNDIAVTFDIALEYLF